MTGRESFRLLALVGALTLAPLIAACAGGSGGPGLAPTEGQMIGHYGRFSEIQSSLIMGDLEAAQTAAQSLESRPMPPTTSEWVNELQAAAHAVTRATSVEAAAEASGRLAMSCGGCHAAVGARPNVRLAAGAPRGDSRADHMSRAMWAVDQLMDGLISGDNEYWMNGAGVLMDDEGLGTMGETVAAATGTQRGIVYGQVLKACADCHTN